MLTVFGIDHEVGANKDSFKELCPAFIQQMQSDSCTAQATPTTHSKIDAAKSKLNQTNFVFHLIVILFLNGPSRNH